MGESLPGRRAISPVELLVHGDGGGCVQSDGGVVHGGSGGCVKGGGGSNIVSIAINWIAHP